MDYSFVTTVLNVGMEDSGFYTRILKDHPEIITIRHRFGLPNETCHVGSLNVLHFVTGIDDINITDMANQVKLLIDNYLSSKILDLQLTRAGFDYALTEGTENYEE